MHFVTVATQMQHSHHATPAAAAADGAACPAQPPAWYRNAACHVPNAKLL
jgi:hypothetical protein